MLSTRQTIDTPGVLAVQVQSMTPSNASSSIVQEPTSWAVRKSCEEGVVLYECNYRATIVLCKNARKLQRKPGNQAYVSGRLCVCVSTHTWGKREIVRVSVWVCGEITHGWQSQILKLLCFQPSQCQSAGECVDLTEVDLHQSADYLDLLGNTRTPIKKSCALERAKYISCV